MVRKETGVGRDYGRVLSLALLWAGVAGASVLPIVTSAPAPRWDVVGCLGLSVAGVALFFTAERRCAEASARLPVSALPARPPVIRLVRPWPMANSGLRRAMTVAAVLVPFIVIVEWTLATAEGRQGPDLSTVLGGAGTVLAFFATWSVRYRGVRARESSHFGSLVCEAAQRGAAQTSSVTVRGWAAGVHRPHPEGASPAREVAARKGHAYSERTARLRLPRRAGALRLSVAGGGERTLFLERPAHPEALADVLNGRQGWLYWASSGTVGELSWTAPAILALGDGRYVQGWTQEGHDPLVPPGTPFASAPGAGDVWQLRPVETAVLRRRRPCHPALVLRALAVLSLVSGLLGVWGAGDDRPLTAAVLMAAVSLPVSGAWGAYELHRAATEVAATGTAPSILAPRPVRHPVPAPPRPSAPPPARSPTEPTAHDR